MTGFGRAEVVYDRKKITIDIKSLNSKTFDLNIKFPNCYKEKEFEIRKILNDRILRGKIDCLIQCENLEESNETAVNQKIIKNYIEQLKNITSDGPDFEYLKMAIQMPDVLSIKNPEIDEKEWNFLFGIMNESIDKLLIFRKIEGKSLHHEIEKSLKNISSNLAQVSKYEGARIQVIKDKFLSALQEFENIDETRYYQEIAFYIEKLDISEEKVRLAQHLKYYEEVMNNEDFSGKKLGFIAQEIGREINTLGSKANHSEIQKLVVEMKDDLEKIKEQTFNVL